MEQSILLLSSFFEEEAAGLTLSLHPPSTRMGEALSATKATSKNLEGCGGERIFIKRIFFFFVIEKISRC